jgi:hypothetical protein
MHKIKYFLVAEKFFKCNLHCRYIRRLEIIFCEMAAAYDVAAEVEEVHIPGAVEVAAYDVAAAADDDVFDANIHVPDVPFLYVPALFHVPAFLLHDL